MQQEPLCGIELQVPDHAVRIHEFNGIDRSAMPVLELDLQHAARMRGVDRFEDGSQWHNISGVFEPLGHIVIVSVADDQQ
jgi:hypothetical protein